MGLILLLESKQCETKQIICVSTTHLLFNPKRGDCKLAQLMLFLAHLDRIAFKHMDNETKKPKYYPTIFCGDFNIDFRSKLYEFIYHSELLNYKNLNRYILSGQIEYSSSYLCVGSLGSKKIGITDAAQFETENDKRCMDQKKKSEMFDGENISHSFNFESVYRHQDKNKFEVTTCIKGKQYKEKQSILYYTCIIIL